jgi:glycosyltransferase involved in cell wall biosynthesis
VKLCVISFKECWQDGDGNWMSSGGFPVQMEALSSLFDEMTLLIVAVQPGNGGLPLPRHAQVVPLRRPSGENTRRKLSMLAHLPYYLSAITRNIQQADVVHAPLPGDIPLLGMLVALVLRKRLIARYGGSWVNTSQATLVGRITKACMRRFAGARNIMIATGEGEDPPAPGMHWLFATALSEKEVINIQTDLSHPVHSPARLVYIGRLSAEKGVANLIQAIGLLKAQGSIDPIPQVILVGDGPERCELERMVVAKGCADCIRFAGQLDRVELSRQLGEMDICVQPSLTEGFSKAWLDAMAHGLPVLASEVGAARSVIGSDGERGWLVPPGDVPALAEALQHVLAAPIDWPALRLRCRTYVEGRTVESWARRIGETCAQQWGLSLVEGRLRR